MRKTLETLKRKTDEGVALLRSRDYFLFLSRLCATSLPRKIALLEKSYLLELAVGNRVAVTASDCHHVRQAHSADLAGMMECSEDDPSMVSRDLFLEFFDAGHVCYVIEKDDAIRGYAWAFLGCYCITYDGYKRSKFTVDLAPNTVFLGNVFVTPDYRRAGLYASMLKGIVANEAKERRIARVVVDVKASNPVSLEVHRNRAFKLKCALYHVALAGFAGFVAVPRAGRIQVFIGNPQTPVSYEDLGGSSEVCSTSPGQVATGSAP